MILFNKKHLKWIIPCLVFAVVIASVYLYKYLRINAVDLYHTYELYTMSPDTTAEELEKNGYLNLTNIQEERSADINLFLRSSSIFRPVIFKTFQETEDDLVIRYFYLPDGANTVCMTTYFVKGQCAMNMMAPFSNQVTETTTDDGTTEVWLIPSDERVSYALSNPLPEPVLFYTYKTP